MFQQDSYSEFMPLRQSSTLSDETLPMNDTNVYANISTVWHAGFLAIEEEKERAKNELNFLNENIHEETLNSTVGNSFDTTLPSSFRETEETVWMEALGCSFRSEEKLAKTIDEEAFYTALDFTLPQDETTISNFNFCDSRDQENRDMDADRVSLNDTLPMDDESIDETF